MKRIGVDFARELIDFSGSSNGSNGHRRHLINPAFAKSQLEGTVAAHNMLAENRVAYIADEVGMGKTYVALGVMGLVRHFRPRRANARRRPAREYPTQMGEGTWQLRAEQLACNRQPGEVGTGHSGKPTNGVSLVSLVRARADDQ